MKVYIISLYVSKLKVLNLKSFAEEFSDKLDIILDINAAGVDSIKDFSGIFTVLSDVDKLLDAEESYEIFKRYSLALSGIVYQNSGSNFFKLSEYKDGMTPAVFKKILVTELLILQKLLNEFGVSNSVLVLPSVSTLEDLTFYYKLLGSLDVKKVSKVFLTLTHPSYLYEISRFPFNKNNLLDGIFLDLESFMKNFFGRDLFSARDYKLVYEVLEKPLLSRNKNIRATRR